jgi:AcrR family transcriptional regulator
MGRPKEHKEETRAALRAAMERLLASGGPGALSVRAVAREANTTTRAVYSLFGSGDGLLVDAIAHRAFEVLEQLIRGLPETDDPRADLVAAGAVAFRTFVREHPALYRVAFQRMLPGMRPGPELTAARDSARARLEARVRRLAQTGLLGDRSVRQAALEFGAMCEGLANSELRGATFSILPPDEEEAAWRAALETVVSGWGVPLHGKRRRAKARR